MQRAQVKSGGVLLAPALLVVVDDVLPHVVVVEGRTRFRPDQSFVGLAPSPTHEKQTRGNH